MKVVRMLNRKKYIKEQIKMLTRAILKNSSKPIEDIRFVVSKNAYKLMQPEAINSVIKELKPSINFIDNRIPIFTIVVGGNIFSKTEFDVKPIRQTVKKALSGLDYIATISFDEVLIGSSNFLLHSHGILLSPISRRQREKIIEALPDNEFGADRFRLSYHVKKEDAIYYVFKAPFGSKSVGVKSNGNIKLNKKKPTLNMLFSTYQALKDYDIRAFMFAGGSGKPILKKLKDRQNDKKIK